MLLMTALSISMGCSSGRSSVRLCSEKPDVLVPTYRLFTIFFRERMGRWFRTFPCSASYFIFPSSTLFRHVYT
ncbi:hypothetical protein B0H34DRAFT_700105 [Crassisporium funariophilum]|nr:hypothetical protein B0H34DRAFT_700105 [Crassisporium funariophilum]